MNHNFLSSTNHSNTPIPAKATEKITDKEPLKHLLIGSPKAVTSTIHSLQVLGYAPVGDWSPLLPTANPGEVMSILSRHISVPSS
jgi:hypothetical protein